MIVTKIQRLRTRKERYRIHCDTGDSFDVSAWTIGKFGVRRGDSLSRTDIDALKEFDTINAAKEYALNFLSYRPRSSAEVSAYLIKKGFGETVAHDVVRNLKTLGMINDRDFARMFLSDQLRKKKQGPNLLRQRLMAKGIDTATIEILLNEFVSSDEQIQMATSLVQKKFASQLRKKKLLPKEYQRISSFLYRRGFTPDVIRTVLKQSTNLVLLYDTE